MPRPEKHVFVCLHQRAPTHPKGSCTTRGSAEVYQHFAAQIEQRSLYGKVALTATGCLGPCEHGANVLVYPDGIMYAGVDKADVETIVKEHFLRDAPVESLRIAAQLWG
ncbi:MAG: (2Fe-2S) ferredoxin domain-containing protein [Planctomycetota bacterium]